jgi:hypothetical protein
MKIISSLKRYSFLGLVFGALLFIPSSVVAWWQWNHTEMSDNAIDILASSTIFSPEKRNRLSGILKYGSIEPDSVRIINHTDIAQCAYMIKKLARKSEEMVKNEEDWKDVLFVMGQAAHYIQDLGCPHHGIGEYRQGAHEAFESKVSKGYWNPEKFDGFHYIADYKKFAYNTARFSARYIYFADQLNFNSMGEKHEYYYRELMEPLWDRVVNDTVDLWLTILKNGLGDEAYKEFGLPPQVAVRDEKTVKYERVYAVGHIKKGAAASCFIGTTKCFSYGKR